jgi:hypothetical protein
MDWIAGQKKWERRMAGRALLRSAPPPFAYYKAQLPIPSPDTVQKLWEDRGATACATTPLIAPLFYGFRALEKQSHNTIYCPIKIRYTKTLLCVCK